MTTPPPIKITDEMIEAGGAAFDRLQDGNRGAGYDRGIVRAIAEAVAPLIAAQVLREAADLINQHIVTPLGLTCPSCGARPGAAAKPLTCDNPIHWPENGRERSLATGGVVDSSQVYIVGEHSPPPLVDPARTFPYDRPDICTPCFEDRHNACPGCRCDSTYHGVSGGTQK